MSGFSAISWSAAERRRAVVSWPAAKRKVAIRTTSRTSGIDPSGKVAVARPDEHVVARLASPILDVGGEPRRGTPAGCDDHSSSVVPMAPGRCAPNRSRNSSWSASGTPSRSATTSSAKGSAYSRMNSHLPRRGTRRSGDRRAPHERLVLLEALRRDQAHQQRAVVGVLRRIERRELVVHRQLVAVLLDERADVVALERNGKPRERTGHGVARREGRGVVVHRERLVVARHHHDVVVRLAANRAGLTQCRSRGKGRGPETGR